MNEDDLVGLRYNDDAVQPFWDEFQPVAHWKETQWALFGTEHEQALAWAKDLGDINE